MKNVLLTITCLLSLAFFVSGCAAEKFAAAPNHLTKQNGWLYLKNGEKIQGEISVNSSPYNTVNIVLDNKSTRTYRLTDVAACVVDAGIFEPVQTRTASTVLMQRLTPDSFTIRLYEAYEQQPEGATGDISIGRGLAYNLEYYIHLPGDNPAEVWKLSAGPLPGHVSGELEQALSSCPELVSKVQISDPEYDISFAPQINLGDVQIGMSAQSKKEKAQLILRVLGEYEHCKKFSRSINHAQP